MRQLHVQDPWARLAYPRERDLVEDLLTRIEVLEKRINDLEASLEEPDFSADEAGQLERLVAAAQ